LKIDTSRSDKYWANAELALENIRKVLTREAPVTDMVDISISAAKMYIAAKATENNAAQIEFLAERALRQIESPKESE